MSQHKGLTSMNIDAQGQHQETSGKKLDAKQWEQLFVALIEQRLACERSKIGAFSAFLLAGAGIWVMVSTQMIWIGGISFAIGGAFCGFFSARFDGYRNLFEKVCECAYPITDELIAQAEKTAGTWLTLKVLRKIKDKIPQMVQTSQLEPLQMRLKEKK